MLFKSLEVIRSEGPPFEFVLIRGSYCRELPIKSCGLAFQANSGAQLRGSRLNQRAESAAATNSHL
jgi:hypothetical protein